MWNIKIIPFSRFTTIKKSRGLKSTSEEKLKFRDELKKIKSLSRELIEQRKQIKENKKQRRRENLERQRENEKKSEILQVVSTTLSILNLESSMCSYVIFKVLSASSTINLIRIT